MKPRFPVLIAAATAIALVAAAVPAFGDDVVAPTFDRRASAGALAKARRALALSRGARRQARLARQAALGAGTRAEEARAHANGANALAEEDRSQLRSTQSQLDDLMSQVEALAAKPGGGNVVSASATGTIVLSPPFGEYEAKGGPSVEVTVPPSGLVEVWAQVEIQDHDGGAVGLFEDGHPVTGISEPELCGDGSALIDAQGEGPGEFVSYSTPPTPSLLGCANAGAPAAVLLSRPPGPHTYELRYSQCSCGTGAEFRDRVLRVAPRP